MNSKIVILLLLLLMAIVVAPNASARYCEIGSDGNCINPGTFDGTDWSSWLVHWGVYDPSTTDLIWEVYPEYHDSTWGI